jgi:hypothetical protein
MTVYQTKQSFQCRHDAHPKRCIEENCPNWTGLAKDDIRSLLGPQSSSVLAGRYVKEKGVAAYQALRRTAMLMNPPLIPFEKIPASLIPD